MTDLPSTTASSILMHYNANPSATQYLSTPMHLHEASLLASSGPASSSPAFSISTSQLAPSNINLQKRKRRPAGTPDPDAEVVALSPKTLMESDRYVCEICNQGFQRDQNLQMHRRRHKVPWKLLKRLSPEVRKRVYVCPEPSCLHHDPCHALGDLVGIKKHYRRKHSCVKQWECEKCSKAYAVQSDYKAHLKTCGTRGHCCDCGRVFSRVESFIEHQDTCGAARDKTAVGSSDRTASLPSLAADTQKATSPTPSADTISDYHHTIMTATSLIPAADRDGAAPAPRCPGAGACFFHLSDPLPPNSSSPALPSASAPPPAASSWAVQPLISTEEQQRGAELQLLPYSKHLHIESSQSSVTWGKDRTSAISTAACSPSSTDEKTAKSSKKNSAPPKLQLSIGLYQESGCDHTSTPSISRPSEGKGSCLMPDTETILAWPLAWRPMDSLKLPARLNDDASTPMAMASAKTGSASSDKQLPSGSVTDSHVTNLKLATGTRADPAPQPNGAELVSQTKSCNGGRSASDWKETSTVYSCRMLQEYQSSSMEASTSALDLALQQQEQQRRLSRESAAIEAPAHESEQIIPGQKQLLSGRCNSAAELLLQEAGEQLKRAAAEKHQAERAWQEAKRERELAEAELASAHRIREQAHSQLQLQPLKAAAAFHHTSSSSSSPSSSNSHSFYSQLHRYNCLITCPTCHQTQIVYPAVNMAAPLLSDTLAGAHPESPPIITHRLPLLAKTPPTRNTDIS